MGSSLPASPASSSATVARWGPAGRGPLPGDEPERHTGWGVKGREEVRVEGKEEALQKGGTGAGAGGGEAGGR